MASWHPKKGGSGITFRLTMAVALLFIVIGILFFTLAVQAKASTQHWRTIPGYVLAATRIAADVELPGTGHRCRFTEYRHHIRCSFTYEGIPARVVIHRTGYSRYLWVGYAYGVVIFRRSMVM
jgi:hypothetical protein